MLGVSKDIVQTNKQTNNLGQLNILKGCGSDGIQLYSYIKQYKKKTAGVLKVSVKVIGDYLHDFR